jgi:hypothetical protein
MQTIRPALANTQLLPQHHLFTNLNLNNTRYRILTNEYNKTMSALNNLEVFWVVVILVEIAVCVWTSRGRVEVIVKLYRVKDGLCFRLGLLEFCMQLYKRLSGENI